MVIAAEIHAVRCFQKSVRQIDISAFWLDTLNSNAPHPIRIYGNCHSILAAIVKK